MNRLSVEYIVLVWRLSDHDSTTGQYAKEHGVNIIIDTGGVSMIQQ
jgi:hypothetical protein